MNTVTFSLAVTKENLKIINGITELLINTANAPVMETEGDAKPAKTDKPVDSTATTLAEFKSGAKKSKDDNGEDFTLAMIEKAGAKVGATLGRTVSKVPAEDYDAILKLWAEGITDDDSLGDDDLEYDGLEDDTPEIDIDAVKVALRAYSKANGRDEAKALMTKHGLKALSELDKMSQSDLAKLMTAAV